MLRDRDIRELGRGVSGSAHRQQTNPDQTAERITETGQAGKECHRGF
jgi:hypothetical protein